VGKAQDAAADGRRRGGQERYPGLRRVTSTRHLTGVTEASPQYQLDPNLAVTNVRTYELALGESLARERLIALLSGAFALCGLLLAGLGLYGLLAFLVAERTKQIGIRMALGAQARQVTRSIVASGLRLAAIGAAIGIAGSLVVLQSLRTMLFGVTPNDATTYGAVMLVLGGVAAIASYVPARWAARVEPVTALRQD
jgi:ABC-type antimicrobial peptide transport system permease subunit